MDELEMRKAEVEALRTYYKKTKSATTELEDTLRLLQKSNLPIKVQKAIEDLIGEQK